MHYICGLIARFQQVVNGGEFAALSSDLMSLCLDLFEKIDIRLHHGQ